MLLGGLFTPTRSMPSWAYTTTYINPMSYFIEAVRTVFVRGGTTNPVYDPAEEEFLRRMQKKKKKRGPRL